MYDYLIVGAGLFGSVCARELTNRGKKCLVIDRRNHIGGNCYDEFRNNIHVSKYGGHYFHTNSEYIWNYVNRFAKFNQYNFVAKACVNGSIYSYPINLMTLQQLWGIKTPEEARRKIDGVRILISNPLNFEEKILSLVGAEIYEKFFLGYNYKHWGTDPRRISIDLIKRIVIRYNYDDRYFDDKFQGMPKFGYTEWFKNILDGIEVRLETCFDNKIKSEKVIYTGSIDEYNNFCYGELEYRGVRHEYTHEEIGSAMITYPDITIPYTRKFSYSYGYPYLNNDGFITALEYPVNPTIDERAYPINNNKNNLLYEKYKQIPTNNVFFGGRLGSYQYSNMDRTIASALTLVQKISGEILEWEKIEDG